MFDIEARGGQGLTSVLFVTVSMALITMPAGGLHEYFVEQISLQLFLLTAYFESQEIEATMKIILVTYCFNDSLTKSIIPPFLVTLIQLFGELPPVYFRGLLELTLGSVKFTRTFSQKW